jgi:hypothetical protein
MTTQQRNRSAVASAAHVECPLMTAMALSSAVAIPPIVFLFLVQPPLVLPSMSALALVSAAVVALVAWCLSSKRQSRGITLWDVSGAYAFIGFAAGMLSDPQQVVELWSVPTLLHEAAR